MTADAFRDAPTAATLHTLLGTATHAVEIRHSRFIAHAVPLASDDDAARAIQALSDADATHSCWAWRVGDAYRWHDDGEPAGTAGRPILAAIDGQGVDRVAVVVVRWYGGIKLGAGGLARAYGGTAAECLRRAPRTLLVTLAVLAVHARFDDIGHVHSAMATFEAEKLSESFDPRGAFLTLRLPANLVDALKIHLRDATRDRVQLDDPLAR